MWGESSVLIGATRCDDKCENTVLLETQGPFESVRKCSTDTVTDDTSARVENVTIFYACLVHELDMLGFRPDMAKDYMSLWVTKLLPRLGL